MSPNYIKTSIDNGLVRTYSSLEDSLAEELNYEIIASKVMFTGQILGTTNDTIGEVEHTIKLWISDDSPNDEIGKKFKSKVRVVAGQQLPQQEYALTPGSCFDFNKTTGTITGYHANECTKDYLVVPQKIDGVMVRSIDFFTGLTSSTCSNCVINWKYVDLTQATGLETIGDHTLRGYIGRGKELIIPDSVKSIGLSSFHKYSGSKLVLGSNIETIGGSAFQGYVGTNEELIIPNNVSSIGSGAFLLFNGKNLIIGDNVKIIDGSAFEHYEGINQELIIPDNVNTIEINAFNNFNGSKLILGRNVETIGIKAFENYVGSNQEFTIYDRINNIRTDAFRSYIGKIYIDMTSLAFNALGIDDLWHCASAELVFKK